MMHITIPLRVLGVFCVILAACAGPSPQPAANSAGTGRYGHELHDRFYEAWQQPAVVGLRPMTISVPVDIKIDSSGHVLGFRIVRPSGNPRIDGSITALEKTVRHVPPPPGTAPGKTFKLRIYFELDVT